MENEIHSLSEDLAICFRGFRKHFLAILIFTLVGLLLGAGATTLVTQSTYTATSSLFFNAQNYANYNNLALSNLLSDTKSLATSYKVLDSACDLLDDPQYTVQGLRQIVYAETSSTSNLVTLYCESSDSQQAISVVNAVSQALWTEMNVVAGAGNVSILEYAQEAALTKAVGQTKINILIASVVAAFIISSVAVMLSRLFSKKVISIKSCTCNGSIDLLGVVPELSPKNRGKIRRE